MEEINIHFGGFRPARYLANKFNLQVSTVVSIYLCIAFLLTLSHTLGYFIVLLTGLLYPGFIALTSLASKDHDHDKQWFGYWVLFSLNNFLDYLLTPVIPQIPFYYSSRLLFTIYLFWPTTKGAEVIYKLLEIPLKFNENSKKHLEYKSKSMKED